MKNNKYVKNVGCFGSGTTPPPTGGTGQPPPAVTGGATWRTVFADEFTGAAVDRNEWNVADNSNFGSGNNAVETFDAHDIGQRNYFPCRPRWCAC